MFWSLQWHSAKGFSREMMTIFNVYRVHSPWNLNSEKNVRQLITQTNRREEKLVMPVPLKCFSSFLFFLISFSTVDLSSLYASFSQFGFIHRFDISGPVMDQILFHASFDHPPSANGLIFWSCFALFVLFSFQLEFLRLYLTQSIIFQAVTPQVTNWKVCYFAMSLSQNPILFGDSTVIESA